MLKKFFVAGLVTLTAFINSPFNVCNADIPRSEISLGSIGLFFYNNVHYRGNYVEKIYGKPTRGNLDTSFATWYYGDSVEIKFEEGLVSYVYVKANNGWKTPSGLAVGMKLSDAERMYGKADYIKTNGNKILYVYFGNPREFDVILGVLANRADGKILSLTAGGSRMQEHYLPGFVENILK